MPLSRSFLSSASGVAMKDGSSEQLAPQGLRSIVGRPQRWDLSDINYAEVVSERL